MHEPAFWNRPSSLLARLLMPLGALYGAIAARRLVRTGVRAGVPVICVGNYHVGGAGKTPTVLALAGILRTLGETPVVLSRGYGGRLGGPVRVDPHKHTAADVGDEPLMMAGRVPVIVSRQRDAGIAPARALGASVILMDDGFQNPAVAKDISLIVIDGDRAIGNGRVFPAGPLRAPLPLQLARTDALVIVGTEPPRTKLQQVSARKKALCCGGSLSRMTRRLRPCAAGVSTPLPASAIPCDSSGACAPAASMWSRSARSPTIIRFRKATSQNCRPPPNGMV